MKTAPRPRPARPPGEIRIIGGLWRRTRLPVPDRPGLRPTPDRVRETLFNWLGGDLQGWRCADVFAGTGALGLEAASRGAAPVQWCEQDRELARGITQHLTRLQAREAQVHVGDGLRWLQGQAGASWDLLLLDPPFDSALFEPALAAARAAVADAGWCYLEAPRAWSSDELAARGWRLHRHLRAGQVFAHLLAAA